jgi:4-amino-4-deoxy-L-arabinose transferase-like glycosyltransferase
LDTPGSAPRPALALLAIAFVVRLAWGLGAGVTPGGGGFDDAGWYHKTASALARGSGYVSPYTGLPTAAWPPGYPVVLSAGYRLMGPSPTVAVVMNVVFGTLTCFFVWRLGTRLGGRRVGLVATMLLAFFPSQIFFTALVLSETLFTCLTCGLLLLAVRLLDRAETARTRDWFLWGLALGGVALVRAEAVALVLIPAASLATVGTWRPSARVLAAALLGALVALTPWTIRNARHFHAFVPTSTGLGRTLWIGHNPIADGSMSMAIQLAMDAVLEAEGTHAFEPHGELAVNRLLTRRALAFALANPGRELTLLPARVYHLFRGDHVWQAWYDPGTPRFAPSESARTLLGRIGDGYYLVVGVLAVAGWFLRGRRAPGGWRVIGATIVVWTGIFTLIYGDPRFHHVLVPLACLLAAVTITHGADIRAEREWDGTRAA